jgi:2'-hydroxyisoflavone reductase
MRRRLGFVTVKVIEHFFIVLARHREMTYEVAPARFREGRSFRRRIACAFTFSASSTPLVRGYASSLSSRERRYHEVSRDFVRCRVRVAGESMNVLVLGGTRFAGRHIIEALVLGGHRVVCFHRGETVCELPPEVEVRLGDRNGDLSALDSERWDAIVDVNAYESAQVERSLELRANRYAFISTVSVYRDLSQPYVAEEAPTIEAFDPTDPAERYGGNKAACERLVEARHPQTFVILRPGLIAGKWDYTGRFAYWCERVLRGGQILVPAPPDRHVQFVDAADLARFAELALSCELSGIFNVVGPARSTTMQELLITCESVAGARGAPPSRFFWADGARLVGGGVQPWTEMPLWVPDAQWAGLMEVGNAKALAAGLTLRPITDTVNAVLDWTQASEASNPAGIDARREAELLASLG